MLTVQRAAKAAGKHISRTLLGVRTMLGAPRKRNCPACGNSIVGFFRYGECADWGCPVCGASPRERLVNHLLDTGQLVIGRTASILHMAPNEASLVARFAAASAEYIPADLDPARYNVPGVVAVDLMHIGMTQTLDLFYASHVMEHVPDDALVLRNIWTALRPGGEAWLIVPLWDKPTVDGDSGMSGAEREQRFGQWDHVRQYGPDFADRIRAAGFELDILSADDLPADDRAAMGLGEILYRARKPDIAAQ
ncbi:MAG: methyltransferase domain-containing protein [Sphingobium sp.]